MGASVDRNVEVVLYDPQTSGGLLIAVPRDRVELFEQELKKRKAFGQAIGEVEKEADTPLIVE